MAQSSARLRWLDALRGYAALVVCCYHFIPIIVDDDALEAITHNVDVGKYAVLLFFLVSGYVIPFSLERHGSLRRFWIGRLFRVYPAYLASLLAVGALGAVRALPTQAADRTSAEIVIDHLIMMPELLGTPSALVVYWTLGYEMLFYLLVSALFVAGLHRMSCLWAVGFAVAALLVAGSARGGLWAIPGSGRVALVAVTAVAAVGAIAGYLRGTRRAVWGAASLSAALVSLLFVHSNLWVDVEPRFPGEALSFLAIMFTGSMIYRAEQQGVFRYRSVASFIVVAGALAATGLLAESGATRRLITLALVTVSFAVAYSLRGRRKSRFAVWLGKISYSLYLLHFFVVSGIRFVFPGLEAAPAWQRVVAAAVYLALAMGAGWLSYRIVEVPGQRVGRLVTSRFRRDDAKVAGPDWVNSASRSIALGGSVGQDAHAGSPRTG